MTHIEVHQMISLDNNKMNYRDPLDYNSVAYGRSHGLRTLGEEIAFTERPKTQSQSQIVWYDRSIFCLPHQPKILDFFDLCLHWVSVVRGRSLTGLAWVSAAAYGRYEAVSWKTGGCSFWKLSKMI